MGAGGACEVLIEGRDCAMGAGGAEEVLANDR